jgi:hypothetical protein
MFNFYIPKQSSNYNSTFSQTFLKNNNQAKNKQQQLNLMDKLQLKSQFNESITKARSQSNHIWAKLV